MKINQKWTYPILGVALLSMIFMGSLTPTPENRSLGSIAAKVDSQEITKAEFASVFEQTKSQYQYLGRQPQLLAYNTMKQLIEKRAWFEVAQKNGALASQEEYTLAITQTNPSISRDAFKQWINAQGYTESQFAEIIRAEVSGQKLSDYISKLAFVPSYEKKIDDLLKATKIDLSYLKIERDESSFSSKASSEKVKEFLANTTSKNQVTNYYNSNKSKYQRDKRVKVSNLLVSFSSEGKNKRSKKEARKKAENLLKQAQKKASNQSFFHNLVVKETDEPNGKIDKGDLGYIAKSTNLPKEIVQAALKLNKTGELSPILETKFGYQILMATDIRKAKNISLEQASEEIARELMAKQERRKESNLVTEQILTSLKEKKDVSKLLKKYKLKWETYTIALNPESNYHQTLPFQEFHKIGLDLSKEEPLSSQVIRKKDANYIIKFLDRKKEAPKKVSEEQEQYALRSKQSELLYFYRDLVFNKEFDIDGAFKGKGNKKHQIKINMKYLALDSQNNT